MSTQEIKRNLVITALAAGVLFTLMLSVSYFNGGVTAQDFEALQTPRDYARAMDDAAPVLRAILTYDFLFIFAYTAAFLFLAIERLQAGQPRLLVLAGLAGLLSAAVLDLHEDAELLVLISTVKLGRAPLDTILHQRVVWSQLKFFSSYLGFFLMAFVLPKDTLLEKMLRQSLWFVYPLVGTLVYTLLPPASDWLSLVRYVFMGSGFFLLAWNYSRRD